MKRKENYILQNLGGEYILIPVGTEVINLNGIIVLNNTGRFIWEKLTEENTIDELIKSVTENFDVNTETAEKDVKIFIKEIKEKGLIIS